MDEHRRQEIMDELGKVLGETHDGLCAVMPSTEWANDVMFAIIRGQIPYVRFTGADDLLEALELMRGEHENR